MTETDVEVQLEKTDTEVQNQIGSGWGAAWSLMPWAEYGDVIGTVTEVVVNPSFKIIGISLGSVGEEI